ncbi:hypothetical protein GF366_00735 [Candidatus Peregrinibacteria bacterium]|nr:hypothetical protein [Candidatus Peregrinibacteria bacterium]
MKKTPYLYFFLLFLGILTVKILITLLFHGPTIIPDEGCIVQISRYFAENFKLVNCEELRSIPGGNPPALIPIIFSLFYALFKPVIAYKAILVFHSILVSSLIFPLYKIFKRFIKKDVTIFIISGLLLFIPQFLTYEKSVMSETLFAVTNVWLLYFYIESFDKNKIRNKTIAIILGILSIFLRPFGFITPFAIIINEFILSKNKKRTILIFIPALILAAIPTCILYSDVINKIPSIFSTLLNLNNIVALGESILNQFNSLNMAVLSIPLILLVIFFNKEKSHEFKKIRFFILSFIILNLALGIYHLYGYFMKYGEQPDILTRYINVSIIFTLIFGLIFVIKNKEFKLSRKNLIISGIIILPLLFMETEKYKGQLMHEFIHITFNEKLINGFNIFITVIVIALFILLINNKKKLLITGIFLTLLLHSTSSMLIQGTFSKLVHKQNEIYLELKDEKNKILYLKKWDGENSPSTYWTLKNMTENEIETAFFKSDDTGLDNKLPKVFKWEDSEVIDLQIDPKNFDYIITNIELDFPIRIEGTDSKVYKTSES